MSEEQKTLGRGMNQLLVTVSDELFAEPTVVGVERGDRRVSDYNPLADLRASETVADMDNGGREGRSMGVGTQKAQVIDVSPAEQQENILAITRYYTDQVRKLNEGFHPASELGSRSFFRTAHLHHVFGPRIMMENNPHLRQLLPYEVLCIAGEPVKIVLYRRLKGKGEARIAGAFSIGWGGHIEQEDSGYMPGTSSVVNLESTLRKSHRREMSEETILRQPPLKDSPTYESLFLGLINDNSNGVGQCHLAFVLIGILPPGTEVASREGHQEIVGTFTIHELLNHPNFNEMENWTQITLRALANYFTPEGGWRDEAIIREGYPKDDHFPELHLRGE